MTDQLEIELREVFEREASIADHSIERLLSFDFHPRRRLSRHVAVAGGVGVALSSGAVAAALTLFGPVPSAFASWSRTPTAAPRSQVTEADASCESRLSNLNNPEWPNDPSARTNVLTDTRGPYTIDIYLAEEPNNWEEAACLEGPPNSEWSGLRTYVAGQWPPPPIPTAEVINGGLLGWERGSNITVAIGQVGSDVTGVELTLTDGTDVEATVENGWWAAWWPGLEGFASSEVETTEGEVPGTITSPPNLPTVAAGPIKPVTP